MTSESLLPELWSCFYPVNNRSASDDSISISEDLLSNPHGSCEYDLYFQAIIWFICGLLNHNVCSSKDYLFNAHSVHCEVMKSPLKLCYTDMCQNPHFASFSYSGRQHVSQLFLECSFLLAHMVFASVSGAKRTWSALNPVISLITFRADVKDWWS